MSLKQILCGWGNTRVTLSGISRSSCLKKVGVQEAADFQRSQLSPGWPFASWSGCHLQEWRQSLPGATLAFPSVNCLSRALRRPQGKANLPLLSFSSRDLSTMARIGWWSQELSYFCMKSLHFFMTKQGCDKAKRQSSPRCC